MSDNEFTLDYNRLGDKNYLEEEEVFNYLFEISYQHKKVQYRYDGKDPEHILYDKNRVKESFSAMIRRYLPCMLKSAMMSILSHDPKPIYYSITCVVCQDKYSEVLYRPCYHHIVCLQCYTNIKYKGLKDYCPMCRTKSNKIAFLKRSNNKKDN